MLGSLLILCWLVATTTTQDTSSSDMTCEGIGAKLKTRHMIEKESEGNNASFLCYKKQNTSAIWRLRIWNGENYESQYISSSTNTPGVLLESDLGVEVHGRCGRNCTQDGKTVQYHCFRLTIPEVNSSLHESLISCGYEENLTLCNGNATRTEKLTYFYVDPFRLSVQSMSATTTAAPTEVTNTSSESTDTTEEMGRTTTAPDEETSTSSGGVTQPATNNMYSPSLQDVSITTLFFVLLNTVLLIVSTIYIFRNKCKECVKRNVQIANAADAHKEENAESHEEVRADAHKEENAESHEEVLADAHKRSKCRIS